MVIENLQRGFKRRAMQPLYRKARKKGFSVRKSLYISQVPASLMYATPPTIVSAVLPDFAPYMAIGVFLAGEIICPYGKYADYVEKKEEREYNNRREKLVSDKQGKLDNLSNVLRSQYKNV